MVSYIKTDTHVLRNDYGCFESGDIVHIQDTLDGIALCTSFLLDEGKHIMVPKNKLDRLYIVADEEDYNNPSFVSGVEVDIITVTDRHKHVISLAKLSEDVCGRGMATCSGDDVFDISYGKLLSQLRSVIDVIESVTDVMVVVGTI